MGKKYDLSAPMSEVSFRCTAKGCRHTFDAEPGRVEDAPELEHHPFAYFAPCPLCGEEAPQVWWQKNLMKGHAMATGPRTPEGLAVARKNLEGHPTPEEALRTRFNAMKHGLNARTATYFPAKPDRYDFCAACDEDRAYCAKQPACVRKTELFMLHHAAFEQRNPKHLMGIYADLQAAVFAVVQQIMQTILADGVKIEQPEYYTDKEGRLIVAEYFDEDGNRRIIRNIQAHPLFRPLGEMLSRANLTLSDMGMTAKVVEDEEEAMGKLDSERAQREDILAFNLRQVEALENLHKSISASRLEKERDPVLIEYRETNQDG